MVKGLDLGFKLEGETEISRQNQSHARPNLPDQEVTSLDRLCV